jgi:hypothetical protein
MSPDSDLITIAELAAKCRSGEDWIRKGCAARQLPHTRIARKILFTPEQAAQIIASRAVPVATVPTRDQVAARRAAVTSLRRTA